MIVNLILREGWKASPADAQHFGMIFIRARKKAEFHMLQVHEQGKSVLTRESMEKAEHYVHQLQKYTLHATMERDE